MSINSLHQNPFSFYLIKLPPQRIYEIVSFLDEKSIQACANVSKKWMYNTVEVISTVKSSELKLFLEAILDKLKDHDNIHQELLNIGGLLDQEFPNLLSVKKNILLIKNQIILTLANLQIEELKALENALPARAYKDIFLISKTFSNTHNISNEKEHDDKLTKLTLHLVDQKNFPLAFTTAEQITNITTRELIFFDIFDTMIKLEKFDQTLSLANKFNEKSKIKDYIYLKVTQAYASLGDVSKAQKIAVNIKEMGMKDSAFVSISHALIKDYKFFEAINLSKLISNQFNCERIFDQILSTIKNDKFNDSVLIKLSEIFMEMKKIYYAQEIACLINDDIDRDINLLPIIEYLSLNGSINDSVKTIEKLSKASFIELGFDYIKKAFIKEQEYAEGIIFSKNIKDKPKRELYIREILECIKNPGDSLLEDVIEALINIEYDGAFLLVEKIQKTWIKDQFYIKFSKLYLADKHYLKAIELAEKIKAEIQRDYHFLQLTKEIEMPEFAEISAKKIKSKNYKSIALEYIIKVLIEIDNLSKASQLINDIPKRSVKDRVYEKVSNFLIVEEKFSESFLMARKIFNMNLRDSAFYNIFRSLSFPKDLFLSINIINNIGNKEFKKKFITLMMDKILDSKEISLAITTLEEIKNFKEKDNFFARFAYKLIEERKFQLLEDVAVKIKNIDLQGKALLEVINYYLYKENIAKAIDLSKKIIDDFYIDQALVSITNHLAKNNNFLLAKEIAKKIRNDRRQGVAFSKIIDSLFKAGNITGALDLSTKITEEFPKKDVLLETSECLAKNDYTQEALIIIQKIGDEDTQDLGFFKIIEASSSYYINSTSQAVDLCNKIKRTYLRDIALSHVCQTLYRSNKISEAISVAEKIEDDSRQNISFKGIVGAIFNTRNFILSINLINRIKNSLSRDRTFKFLSKLWAQKNNIKQALAIIDRIIDLDLHDQALWSICKILRDNNNMSLAQVVASHMKDELQKKNATFKLLKNKQKISSY